VSCGPAHSSARELVAQGNEAKLVAETLAISRSSLYYRRKPRASRAHCCTREIVGWDLSLRCRTEEALAAFNRAVLEVLPFGSRGTGLTLTTDNGTQFTSARYVETLNQLGITHRRTAYNHPEGNSYIERFHRSLKEEEVWLNEYQNFDQAALSIARWRGVQSRPSASRTPRTNPALCSCPVRPNPYFKHGPLCQVLRGALHKLTSTHFEHGHLKSVSFGKTMWPQFLQTHRPLETPVIKWNFSSTTQ
jgi:hypothetical protein